MSSLTLFDIALLSLAYRSPTSFLSSPTPPGNLPPPTASLAPPLFEYPTLSSSSLHLLRLLVVLHVMTPPPTLPQTPSYSTPHHTYHPSQTRSSSSSTTIPTPYRPSSLSRPSRPSQQTSSAGYWRTVLEHHDPENAQLYGPRQPMSAFSSPRECPACKREFSSTRAFEDHIRLCSPQTEKPYACDECGTAFKKNSNLVKHMKLVHLGERNFQCTEPNCGRLFGQKSNLNSHIKAVHLREKPFVCQEGQCGRRFSQKSGLKAHIKTVHNGERPYVCECGSSFGHRGDVSIFLVFVRQLPQTFAINCLVDFSSSAR